MVAPRLLIFDCDGVLVDSEPMANRKLVEHAAAHGLQLELEATLHEFNGATLSHRVATLAARHGWSPPADFVREVDDQIDASVAEADAIPGVAAVLRQLADAGVPMCLASNSRHREIEIRLAHLGFTHYFSRRFSGAEDVAHAKPAPNLYLHAAREMGVAPAECVVIEDSENGIRAACAAGTRVFGFARFTPHERVVALGATPFADMAELPVLLAGAGLAI
ncbi:HAD family hydrolase [Niveibacterium umoris]|uniref:HAD superfamily hydrolase (TIGR01509 family) n=1 Tax=Niveibacterium umoris TaxID=1193620 RepID=A0A840BG71_9RHOO|nr:HAD family phosphatase [Niveibacterium umoris]MBB4012175.1 HAD superfamily hydrolase (TIGR01509 family) [Niveibacterium umoris]